MTTPAQRPKCKTGCGRDSRCPGTMCKPCWKKAGSPTAEQVAEQRAYDRLRAEGVAPVQKADGLVDDEAETDVSAMEALWLQQGKAVTVRQRAWVPLYQESPKAFRDRLDRLRAGGPSSEPSPGATGSKNGSSGTWNGVGPCPTCLREPDPCAGKTNEELDGLMEAEFAWVDRTHRHKPAVTAFMDREGLT